MFGLRTRPKDVRILASFVLGLCIFSLMPTEAGYQDIGSLLAANQASPSAGRSASLPPPPMCNSPPTVSAAQSAPRSRSCRLSARKPRRARHHRFDPRSNPLVAPPPLSGLRLPQGGSYPEGRSSCRPSACGGHAARTRSRADARPGRSRDFEFLGEGASQEMPVRHRSIPSAAGSARRPAAEAIRPVARRSRNARAAKALGRMPAALDVPRAGTATSDFDAVLRFFAWQRPADRGAGSPAKSPPS